jgi:hypothetical protein
LDRGPEHPDAGDIGLGDVVASQTDGILGDQVDPSPIQVLSDEPLQAVLAVDVGTAGWTYLDDDPVDELGAGVEVENAPLGHGEVLLDAEAALPAGNRCRRPVTIASASPVPEMLPVAVVSQPKGRLDPSVRRPAWSTRRRTGRRFLAPRCRAGAPGRLSRRVAPSTA